MSAEIRRLGQIYSRQHSPARAAHASDHRGLMVIGGVLLLVSVVVAMIYAVDFDFAAYTTFRAPLTTAQGTVTAVQPTDTFEPGTSWSRRDERTRIVAVTYTFADQSGSVQTGTSYLPGARPVANAPVTVEYSGGQSSMSRIQGYRSAMFDRLPLSLGMLVGTGLLLLGFGLYGLRRGDEA